MKNTKIEWCDHKRISRMAYERNEASIMNKNINDRIEYLRDVLIAMINEHTGNGIPEEELKEHSDEVLCAEAALAFRVTQIAMMKFKERADKLEKNQFTREEIDFIKKAISMAILDCETNPPKPSDENLKLMRSIKFKCDELLK